MSISYPEMAKYRLGSVKNTKCEGKNSEPDTGYFLRPGLDKIWPVGLVCFQPLTCLVKRTTSPGGLKTLQSFTLNLEVQIFSN